MTYPDVRLDRLIAPAQDKYTALERVLRQLSTDRSWFVCKALERVALDKDLHATAMGIKGQIEAALLPYGTPGTAEQLRNFRRAKGLTEDVGTAGPHTKMHTYRMAWVKHMMEQCK